MTPEDFVCGNCIYMMVVEPPEEKKKDYPIPRGYCTFNPPTVFPMPQETGRLATMGKKQVGFVPFTLRPAVDANEPMCGRAVFSNEAAQRLGLKEQDSACGDACDCEDGSCGSK